MIGWQKSNKFINHPVCWSMDDTLSVLDFCSTQFPWCHQYWSTGHSNHVIGWQKSNKYMSCPVCWSINHFYSHVWALKIKLITHSGFQEDGTNWIQYVCKCSAERSQVRTASCLFTIPKICNWTHLLNLYFWWCKVIQLKDMLDEKLIQRQARKHGICQVIQKYFKTF